MLYCWLVCCRIGALSCRCIVVLFCWCVLLSLIIFLYILTQQLLQCRSNFFVRHKENLKQQLLMKIQTKKLLQIIKLSNILINLEEPIGYPAHTGLIFPSVCPFVHPSGIWKIYILNIGIKIKKSHLSVVSSLRIPIPMLLYCKLVSNTKNYFPPQPKNWHNSTSHVHCKVHPLLHVGWRNFFPLS